MECTDGTCKTNTASDCGCGTDACACGPDRSCEQCCGCASADPTQTAMKAWHGSFFAALHQAQADRLRKRIESSFGPVLDKEADAVFEAIGRVWNAMITQSDAKRELAVKLQKIYSESNKR